MNQTLVRELNEVLGAPRSGECIGLQCESSLRVAAATLNRTRSCEITATTVVGILGQDDTSTVEALVAEIAEEFGLESRMRMNGGTFSVRFTRVGER